MWIRAIDRQTRHALLRNANVSGVHGADAALLFSMLQLLTLLGLFDRDLLIRIADALALVGLGRTDRTDLGGHLAHAWRSAP